MMRRRALVLLPLLAAAATAACDRRTAETPDIVAIRVEAGDAGRYREMARRCGVDRTRISPAKDAMLFVVEREASLAARICFFDAAAADYRARHPVRAFVEGLIR